MTSTRSSSTPERLGPLDTGGFWLSETPEKHSRSWGTRVARSATWALFGVPDDGLSILHLNTHLDHISALARREGSKLVVEKIAEISDRTDEDPPAIILTGDFNARPGSSDPQEPHRIRLRGHLPRRRQRRGQSANTFHAFRGASYRDKHPARGPRRIDWILLKDPKGRLRIESHSIIHDADERLRTLSERPLSDSGRFQHFRLQA